MSDTALISLWLPEPDPVLHQALGKLAEECAELGQALARCLIQGYHEEEPVTHKLKRTAVREEIADVKAAMRWLFEVTDEIFGESPRERRKLDGFREWQRKIEKLRQVHAVVIDNAAGEKIGALAADAAVKPQELCNSVAKQIMARKLAMEIVEDVRNDGDFALDSPLASLGLDSLDLVEIEMRIEDATDQSQIDRARMASMGTVQDLANLIEEHLDV